MRVLVAGLAAGIAMFVWNSIAHVATPLGTIGVSTLPDESVTVGNLSSAIDAKGGLYVFPMNKDAQASAATAAGGLLVFNPVAPTSIQAKNLIIEFLSELSQALIAVWLLAQTALVGYAARFGFVAMLGLAAVITTNVSYWNWYAFPLAYTLSYSLIELGGYAIAGLTAIAILGPTAGMRAAPQSEQNS